MSPRASSGPAKTSTGDLPTTSWASSPATRRVMQSNRGRDTIPELRLRQEVHARGLRYRVNLRVEPDVRRTVDIAFTKLKLAVFVDGCFWHGCPLHSRSAKTNPEYWGSKIAANQARDDDTTKALRQRGWTVVRFWEHDDPKAAAIKIVKLVKRLRAT